MNICEKGEWQWKGREEKKDVFSGVLTNTKGCGTLSRYLCILFVSMGRILIEMCVCFFSFTFACPQVSEYVWVWVSAVFFACVRVFVRVWVRDSLPLTYVPSFVSEDYSFPFEVRQLARRGRSERRPRAGFHTFPTAACRLGGKYVCGPQRRREKGEESEDEVRNNGQRKGENEGKWWVTNGVIKVEGERDGVEEWEKGWFRLRKRGIWGGKRSREIFRKSVGVKKKVEKGVKRFRETKKIKKEQG